MSKNDVIHICPSCTKIEIDCHFTCADARRHAKTNVGRICTRLTTQTHILFFSSSLSHTRSLPKLQSLLIVTGIGVLIWTVFFLSHALRFQAIAFITFYYYLLFIFCSGSVWLAILFVVALPTPPSFFFLLISILLTFLLVAKKILIEIKCIYFNISFIGSKLMIASKFHKLCSMHIIVILHNVSIVWIYKWI